MTALVTGAGTGIGRGIAIRLAKEGYDVALHYRASAEGALSACDEIRTLGRKAIAIQADISDVKQITAMFDECEEKLGPVDLFVNNAGITKKSPFLDTTEALFDNICGVDFKGAYFCIPGISSIPFVIVRGLKKLSGGKLADIMRGEETETIGLSEFTSEKECVIVLPGTHNKAVRVNEKGEITDFVTMMSGEMISCAVNNTILSSAVSYRFELDEVYALKGAAASKENGVNNALFSVRVMSKNGIDTDKLTSFLYGSIIGEDIDLIKKFAGNTQIMVAGRENLKKIYLLLLGKNACEIPDSAAGSAVKNGLRYIYAIRNNRSKHAETISAIADNKIIAILRRPDEGTLIDGMKALYRAGIRLAEVTFDRSGKYDKEYTARMIRKLNEEFGGRMLIGAGTVMSVEDVMTAYEAGARFMISPNANADVIKLTRDLGLVSIPAAMTPSEIAFACECGADFVKLFPANQFSLRYLKDVTAPISEAKLLAVGGVDAANAKDFIDAGFAGVGIGTAIYNGKLAKEGKFDELYENAKKIVEAVK